MHPTPRLPRSLAGAAVVMTVFVSMAAADTKAPTPPDIRDFCERAKVESCRWEGDRKICEWIDGPDCLVMSVRPRQPLGYARLPRSTR